MSDNLKLWNDVEKTDPKYTKEAKIGGMKITAIAPQYQIRLATEQFGPYGKGFGFREIDLDFSLVASMQMVVFKGRFFYPDGEFVIINSSKLYMDRAQQMVDAEFAKKIETDALTKALSKLGFNADVFMGRFDDHRYVDQMREEFKEVKPPNPEVDLIADALKRKDKQFITESWVTLVTNNWNEFTDKQRAILTKINNGEI